MTKPCVLLIEDNKDFREALRHFLELNQVQAHLMEASSGEEGILLAKRKKPEVVVTDFALGGINGLDSAKQIKKNFPGCSIIMLSLYDPDDILRKDVEKVIKFFISKSDLYEDLMPAINNILEDTKSKEHGGIK